MATPQSLLHFSLGALDKHTQTLGMCLKSLAPGLEPQSTEWETSDVNITLSVGSTKFLETVWECLLPETKLEK